MSIMIYLAPLLYIAIHTGISLVLHPLRAGMVTILINGPSVVIKLWLEQEVAQRGYKPTGYWGSLVNNES